MAPLTGLLRQRVGRNDRTVESQHEINILLHPYPVAHMSGERTVVVLRKLTRQHVRMILLFIPGRSVLKVEQHRSRIGPFERIAVIGHTGSGRQLHFYSGFIQTHSIITRRSLLRALVESAAIILPAGACRHGHEQNVAQVQASRPVEVGLRESPDAVVRIAVFRTILPAHRTGDRTGLHQSERLAGSGKRMPVVGISDKGIDITRIVRLRHCARRIE